MPKMLINGILRDKPKDPNGAFARLPSQFRGWIEPDAAAAFPAEQDRYHLYLSKACPWCHGVELVLSLKGLREVVGITWMDPIMSENGWVIDQAQFVPTDGVPRDRYLFEVYQRAAPDYTGAISAPVLLDRKSGKIVSTDSADIMRMLGSAFAPEAGPELYPAHLRSEIDRIADFVQEPVRNGVYRAGFATTQAAYCEAVLGLFEALESLETLLTERQFLAGEQLTEVDLKLFPTLLRFDPVYFTHFKTDRARIADYPALSRYLSQIIEIPEVAATIDMPHIREHYFRSHRHINPAGIISIGPKPISGLQTIMTEHA
ncbi:glutathione S-transferase C-terminal domain-containing protein [Hyphomonas sp. FCG-A18]|uniref:glutathione S-transferase family protein n=1 Tax=Hyphomonas sp. FCG-A18 TaxID=3080019 RepID=UPI002B30E18A|nr:glutathione S-transferase C-terminal domain-containing protein [Hyphomonas sp. FCG-A18]